ncbi:MAG: protein kinase [Clostridiales bacterium]|nr:protein kinase [Clostridiales bacterium]
MENYENIRLPWPDWRIVRSLGSGAYGSVYEIERNVSGIQERAALKIVSRPKDTGEIEAYYDNGYDQASIAASYQSELQNYVKEYKLMKELQGQSNIVSCDDFTVIPNENGIGGKVFIRMELLTSVQQVLRERMLSEGEIIKLGKDISRALVLCENKNIIHRDIKPVNIMISPFGDYKLGDFGVSKIMDHTTFATAMGTPEYQAPEVVHMERYGHTADIYSLGITLYWLLNNRKMPFIGADEMLTPMVKTTAMEKRYRGEKIPAPKNGSVKLKQIVLKACEYRPEDRYASARELYAELEALGTAFESGSHQESRNETVHGTTGNYAQKEGNSWDNSWGESLGSIGNPAGKAQKAEAGYGENDSSGTIGMGNAEKKANENDAVSQQTVRQNGSQTAAASKKEMPAVGTKRSKIIITISGILLFVSLFLNMVNAGGASISMSIYTRYRASNAKEMFWVLSALILLVIIFNLLNRPKWSLIGSFGISVFMISRFMDIFILLKGNPELSLSVYFWLLLASAITFMAAAVKEGVLDLFEKYR